MGLFKKNLIFDKKITERELRELVKDKLDFPSQDCLHFADDWYWEVSPYNFREILKRYAPWWMKWKKNRRDCDDASKVFFGRWAKDYLIGKVSNEWGNLAIGDIWLYGLDYDHDTIVSAYRQELYVGEIKTLKVMVLPRKLYTTMVKFG